MRKRISRWAAMIICMGIMTVFTMGTAMAQSPVIQVPGTFAEEAEGPGAEKIQAETVRIRAVVKAVEDGRILAENQSEVSYQGDILLNVSVYDTQIVNGETGFPAELSDIQAGDVIHADIRTAMTRSLPPQTTAETVILSLPEGSRAPEYMITESMEWQPDESWKLVSTTGSVHQIPADCPVISYGMGELSSFRIISKSSRLLIWLDGENHPQRILKLPARW